VHFYFIFLLASVGFTAATFDAFVVGVACLRFELGFRALGTRDQDPATPADWWQQISAHFSRRLSVGK